MCFLVFNVRRTVIYVEYPSISVDSLLPTRLWNEDKKVHLDY